MVYSIPTVGPEAYTDEWFEKRRSSIGASEAAAICGLSRWQQPLDVYKTKKGASDTKESDEMHRGKLLEPAVLEWYHGKVGGTIFNPPLLIHPVHDFMCATPDALWTPEKTGKLPWSYSCSYIPVEAKTSGKGSDWGEEGTDDIPQEYIMQAQHQMAVTNTARCDVPVLDQNLKFKLYIVNRNQELIDSIIEASREMMERVANNDPPEPNWSHPKTYELIRQVHGVTEGTVQLTEETSELWAEAERLIKESNRLRRGAEINKAKVLHEMGENGIGHLVDGRHLIRKVIKREAKQMKASEYVTLRCKKSL